MNGFAIKKGTKLYVNFLKSGVTKGKRWQFFVYQDRKKNNNGEYVTLQKYTFFINNPNENLMNGNKIVVQEITSIQSTLQEVNGNVYRSIMVNITIEENSGATQEEKDFEEAFIVDNFDINFDF